MSLLQVEPTTLKNKSCREEPDTVFTVLSEPLGPGFGEPRVLMAFYVIQMINILYYLNQLILGLCATCKLKPLNLQSILGREVKFKSKTDRQTLTAT